MVSFKHTIFRQIHLDKFVEISNYLEICEIGFQFNATVSLQMFGVKTV